MKQPREHWGSRLGLILAAAGSAVGLGSVWRFPYIVGENGGGAFVLLYIIFTLILGIPVFISEVIIGRRSQKGPIQAYSDLRPQSQNWKMVGWLNMFTCFLIISYYCVIAGWCTSYILMSLGQFWQGKDPTQVREVFSILANSSDISIFWLFIYIMLNIGIVLAGIRKGIEHWSRILMPAFVVILLGLFGYSMFLKGFPEAFKFVLYPDFSKLSAHGILEALGMAFFTLSVGLGIILTYGSYMKESEDVPKMGFTVAGLTIAISIISALVIFPIVFTYNLPSQGGPGLIFQTMPVIFSQMPGAIFFSTIFFILIVFIALTSSISLLEVLVANLIENFKLSRNKAVLYAGIGIFLLGIPCALSSSGALFGSWNAIYGRNFLETLDHLTANWMMPFAGLFAILFVGWFLDKKLVYDEFTSGTTLQKLFPIWRFSVRWIAPAAVIVIILQEAGIVHIEKLLTLFN
ncbi:MAG: sodium-dependent transporter [Candidatus Algichlamydia australiensis]|nr:sodium-dependent transporter [Chlamydiales bacterium]